MAKQNYHSISILRYAGSSGGERDAWRKVISFWMRKERKKRSEEKSVRNSLTETKVEE